MVFLSTAIGIGTLNSYETLGPLTNQKYNHMFDYNHTISANFFLALGAILPILGGIVKSKVKPEATLKEIVIDQLITFVVGILFGCGLLVSGMCRRINIIGFLGMHKGWNPSLLFVLGCGVGVNLVTFNYMLRVR